MKPSPQRTTGTIRTMVEGPVGWLVVDNEAKRNALSLTMWTQLPEHVETLCDNPDVRLIILRGAGGSSFVSGADISEFEATRATADAARSYDAINVAAFKALKTAAKPTLAMIRGHCLGGGLGLAFACDMRIAAEGSVFAIPAARLGLAYPVEAMADIVEAVGPATAKRLLFTASRLTAGEALTAKVIDELVPEDALEDRCRVLADTISANAPMTLKAAKLTINALSSGAPEDMAKAIAAAEACFTSSDFAEGRSAFLEKRQPSFTGQ
ncbi:enoyl-CoA hydratase [Roseibium litorale]